MIIAAIIALSGVVLAILIYLIASAPIVTDTTFWTYFNYVMPYIVRGVKFLNGFVYPAVVWPLFGICVTLRTFWVGYRVVMWILKKIPMLGIDD